MHRMPESANRRPTWAVNGGFACPTLCDFSATRGQFGCPAPRKGEVWVTAACLEPLGLPDVAARSLFGEVAPILDPL
jgi:hypothetical protein